MSLDIYTEFELKEMKTTDSGSDSCSVEKFDSSRLEDLHWYTCEKCVITFSMAFEECKCCREPASLLSEKLEGIKCITDNNDFKILFERNCPRNSLCPSTTIRK